MCLSLGGIGAHGIGRDDTATTLHHGKHYRWLFAPGLRGRDLQRHRAPMPDIEKKTDKPALDHSHHFHAHARSDGTLPDYL